MYKLVLEADPVFSILVGLECAMSLMRSRICTTDCPIS